MPSIISNWIAIMALYSQLTVSAVLPYRKSPADPIPSTALLGAYAVPLSNGSKSLPELNNALQVITVGRGIQNYTCASTTSADKPKAVGAVATLFNLDSFLAFFAPSNGQTVLNQVPSFMLSLPRDAVDNSIIPQAGVHYFNADGVPTFDLTKSNNGLLLGNKTGDITSPTTAARGTFGNVDWLSLDAKPGSQGLSRVYRVLTASGSPPPSCDGQKSALSVEYAALYYFVSA